MRSLAQITQVALYGSALWLSIPLALVIFSSFGKNQPYSTLTQSIWSVPVATGMPDVITCTSEDVRDEQIASVEMMRVLLWIHATFYDASCIDDDDDDDDDHLREEKVKQNLHKHEKTTKTPV